jgi:hypothetical protein
MISSASRASASSRFVRFTSQGYELVVSELIELLWGDDLEVTPVSRPGAALQLLSTISLIRS